MNNKADRTHQVLDFILDYKTRWDGTSPTMREIMAGVGLSSVSMVSFYLDELESAGRIVRQPNNSRGIIIPGGRWTAPMNPQGPPDQDPPQSPLKGGWMGEERGERCRACNAILTHKRYGRFCDEGCYGVYLEEIGSRYRRRDEHED